MNTWTGPPALAAEASPSVRLTMFGSPKAGITRGVRVEGTTLSFSAMTVSRFSEIARRMPPGVDGLEIVSELLAENRLLFLHRVCGGSHSRPWDAEAITATGAWCSLHVPEGDEVLARRLY